MRQQAWSIPFVPSPPITDGALDCCSGELFDRIIAKGHYTEKQAAATLRTIVGVVQACHSLGVMHRDLKPENFLLADKSEEAPLKATDFGLSVYFRPGKLLDPHPVHKSKWKAFFLA